ncbi:MAG: recombinase family protein [Oscillibacter sp.]|nr:recombinase family protein [Oscillibacter sp.]
MSKVAYVRVSTAEQNEARQREALAVRGIDKWFIEKASGKNTDRPEFQKMLDWVREGDTIYIHDLSRIARSTKDLLDLLDVLREKGVALVSDKESIDTSTATGKLLVTMVAAINEFERANLLERQREGIAIAKREGKYKGRKAVTVPDLPRHYDRWQRREVSKAALARELGISRPTLDRLFSDYNNKCAILLSNEG